MNTSPEYAPQPAFNMSAPQCSAPPSYSPQMSQPTQQMPQSGNVTISNSQPGFASPPIQYVAVTPQLGESPIRMVCPNCRHEMVTNVTSDCSTKQHIICLLMCLSGVLSFCSCLPYCCNDCGNYKHSCPRCHTHIGSYSP